MPYATATDLLSKFSAEEVAQRADRNIPRLVSAELLTAAVAGGDLSAWTVDEQAAAAAALAKINDALVDADSTIDGYLASRYTVPLSNALPVVKRLACDMARFFLYDDQVTDAVKDRNTAAVAFFRDVSTGKVSLGDPAATAPVQGGSVEMTSTPAVWRRESSGGFI